MNNQYMDIVKQNTKQEITHRFIPKPNEKFWYVNPWSGSVVKLTRTPNDYNYKFAKCFKTEEEAKKHLDFLLAEDFLKQKAFELNNGWEPEWGNSEQPKFHIYYSYSTNNFDGNSFYSYNCTPNIIYLKDDKTAQTMINLYNKELKIYFGISDE